MFFLRTMRSLQAAPRPALFKNQPSDSGVGFDSDSVSMMESEYTEQTINSASVAAAAASAAAEEVKKANAKVDAKFRAIDIQLQRNAAEQKAEAERANKNLMDTLAGFMNQLTLQQQQATASAHAAAVEAAQSEAKAAAIAAATAAAAVAVEEQSEATPLKRKKLSANVKSTPLAQPAAQPATQPATQPTTIPDGNN